jgi:hypothetical protein
VCAHSAIFHGPLLPLAASAKARLKCAALAFLIISPFALSSPQYTLQVSAHGGLVCHLLALLAFLTGWVSSLDHDETEKETGFDKEMC